MKMASISEMRRDFNRILVWVSNGEELAITKRGRTVARLLPLRERKTTARRIPDIAGRLRKVFGRKIISDKAMRMLWRESRGDY